MFQGLRQGSLLYMLDKKGTPSLKVGTVTAITQPSPKYTMPQNGMQMPMIEQVVDISVETSDGRFDYKQVPAMASVANFGAENVVLADSQQAMSIEVEAMRNASQTVIDSVEYHRGVLDACASIMDELNPAVARERERDSELSQLREQLTAQASVIARIEQMLRASAQGTKNKKDNGNDNRD